MLALLSRMQLRGGTWQLLPWVWPWCAQPITVLAASVTPSPSVLMAL